ncbi:42388_t:CDS:2, partial [Gigaspora margarita]
LSKDFFLKEPVLNKYFPNDIKSMLMVKDQAIAKWAGISQPEVVTIIRFLCEHYDWIQQKITRKQPISEEEDLFFNMTKIFSKNEVISIVEDRNQKVNNDGELDQRNVNELLKENSILRSKCNKIALTLTETGTLDEGNLHIAEMAYECFNEDNQSKEMYSIDNKDYILKNCEKLAILMNETGATDFGTEECTTLIYNIITESEILDVENKIEKQENARIHSLNKENKHYLNIDKENHADELREHKKVRLNSNKIENNKELFHEAQGTFTLWDIPIYYNIDKIRRLLKSFGQVSEVEYRVGTETKRAVVKLTRITEGAMSFDILEERKKLQVKVEGLPRSAYKVLLLRRLKRLGVKSAYIPKNSNGNQRTIALLSFETQEALNSAINQKIYYGHTLLKWKNAEALRITQIGIRKKWAMSDVENLEIYKEKKSKIVRKDSHTINTSGTSMNLDKPSLTLNKRPNTGNKRKPFSICNANISSGCTAKQNQDIRTARISNSLSSKSTLDTENRRTKQ